MRVEVFIGWAGLVPSSSGACIGVPGRWPGSILASHAIPPQCPMHGLFRKLILEWILQRQTEAQRYDSQALVPIQKKICAHDDLRS